MLPRAPVSALALAALGSLAAPSPSIAAPAATRDPAAIEARFGPRRPGAPAPVLGAARDAAAPADTVPSAAAPATVASADGRVGRWIDFDPVGLYATTAAYDSVADRMITFGGWDGQATVGAFAFDAATNAWAPLNPAGGPPPSRTLPMGAYDPGRRALWVFGGEASGGGFASTLGRLDLAGTETWTDLEPFGTWPDPRVEGGLAYDPGRDRLLLFGGATLSPQSGREPLLSDVWALSPSADTLRWTQLTVPGPSPSPRLGPVVAFDPVADGLFVIGGSSTDSLFVDAWELLFTPAPHWARLDPAGPPPSAPIGGAAVLEVAGERLIGFGGYAPYTGARSSEVWELDLAPAPHWVAHAVAPGGATGAPAGVALPALALDTRRHRLLVHGGLEGDPFSSSPGHTTWALDVDAFDRWEKLAPPRPEPAPRFGQATAYDPVSERAWIFGGVVEGPDSSTYSNELWQGSLGDSVTWQPCLPTGASPPGRHEPVGVYDPAGRRLWFFGGWRYRDVYFDDTWSVTVDSPYVWSRLPGPAEGALAPPGRRAHCAAYDPLRRSMILFGGLDADSVRSDVWELPLDAGGTWRRLVPAGDGPGGLFFASAIYDPDHDRIVLFGGEHDAQSVDELWAIDLAGEPRWERLTAAGPGYGPSSRHSAVYDPGRHRMLVWGGFDIDYDVIFEFERVAALSLDGPPTWQFVAENARGPGPRCAASTVFDVRRDRWITYGGFVDLGNAGGETHAFEFTPVLAPRDAWWSGARAQDEGMALRWDSALPPGTPVSVERRVVAAGERALSATPPAGGEWRAWRGTAVASDGSVTVLDPALRPGSVIDYRLRFTGATGPEAESRVSVPGTVRLLLVRAYPNPAHGALTIQLVSDGTNPLEESVFDLGGRAVFHQTVAAPPAGPASVGLALPGGTRAGVYFARLRQGSVQASRKFVYVP